MARPVITADDIRAYAQRDRGRVAALKLAHWAEQHRLHGSDATITIGRALFEHARRSSAAYPTVASREQDLRDHIALKKKLDRVAHVLRSVR